MLERSKSNKRHLKTAPLTQKSTKSHNSSINRKMSSSISTNDLFSLAVKAQQAYRGDSLARFAKSITFWTLIAVLTCPQELAWKWPRKDNKQGFSHFSRNNKLGIRRSKSCKWSKERKRMSLAPSSPIWKEQVATSSFVSSTQIVSG